MVKKALMVVGGAALLPVFVFGRDALSYLRTAGESVKTAVKAEVPTEFEIQRIHDLLKNLIPDIRQCMHVIAEQQVDIEHLNDDIRDRDSALQKQEEVLLGMTQDLDSGQQTFRYAGQTYTADDVRKDLARRFDKFKVARESIDRDKQILRAREVALKANQDRLEGMLGAKQDLEVDLAQLEARFKSIQAAETVSDLAFDDSQLSQVKQAIRDLNKQLDVKERMLDVEGRFVELIPMEDIRTIPDDLSDQVRDYLGHKPTTAAEVAVNQGEE